LRLKKQMVILQEQLTSSKPIRSVRYHTVGEDDGFGTTAQYGSARIIFRVQLVKKSWAKLMFMPADDVYAGREEAWQSVSWAESSVKFWEEHLELTLDTVVKSMLLFKPTYWQVPV